MFSITSHRRSFSPHVSHSFHHFSCHTTLSLLTTKCFSVSFPVRLALCDLGAAGWGEPWFPHSAVLLYSLPRCGDFVMAFLCFSVCVCLPPYPDGVDTMLSPFVHCSTLLNCVVCLWLLCLWRLLGLCIGPCQFKRGSFQLSTSMPLISQFILLATCN